MSNLNAKSNNLSIAALVVATNLKKIKVEGLVRMQTTTEQTNRIL